MGLTLSYPYEIGWSVRRRTVRSVRPST